MTALVVALIQWIAIPHRAAPASRTECYAIITAVASDSAPGRVRRVITSGIVRALAVPSSANACVIARPAADSTKRILVRQIASDVARVEWIEIAAADSSAVTDHLDRLRKKLDGTDIELVRPH